MCFDKALSQRNYGLDWLRISAFGLLILYHIGMFFVPWSFHLKTAQPIQWLEWPMLALNPWRLILLFVISGIVSRSLIDKLANPSAFAISRSLRLLVPLLAGIMVFVVPQPWIELRDQGVYQASLLYFWLNDYAEFGASRGTPLPTWNHLWFIAYLWAYSMALAALSCLPRRYREQVQVAFNRTFSGWRLFILPIAWLFVARVALYPAYGETHAFTDDPYGHAIYAFVFFFGVGFVRAGPAWNFITANWKQFLVAAVTGLALNFAIKAAGGNIIGYNFTQAATRASFAWCMILGLIGMSQCYLDRDGPARRYLADAVFPYYIAHQTILLLAGYQLKQMAVGPTLEFVGMLLATVTGCALTYEIGRRIRWLRPFLGLKWQPSAARTIKADGGEALRGDPIAPRPQAGASGPIYETER